MKYRLLAAAAALSAFSAVPSQAAPFIVDALANSSSGGVGLASITLAAGQSFSVSSSTDDLWNAGPLPRYSDANGLVADRFATASDDSGEAVGTQIGANFGPYSQNGLSAAYGQLVGRVGSGAYFALGANGTFVAPNAGVLSLFYWDSNNFDNTGSIAFNVTAVPETATWAMMIAGFGLIGGAMRRTRSRKVSFA